MLTLFILVGIYTIQCIGAQCYSVQREVVEALLTAGLLEMLYETKGVIKIYRKKGK